MIRNTRGVFLLSSNRAADGGAGFFANSSRNGLEFEPSSIHLSRHFPIMIDMPVNFWLVISIANGGDFLFAFLILTFLSFCLTL